MTPLRQRIAPIREKRSGSIAAWYGTALALAREAEAGPLAQRVRTFSQDHASDLQRALRLLQGVRGLGLVVHGPAGCASALHGAGDVGDAGAPWVVTAINQRDSIMGGDAALREAIRTLHATHAPRAIAIVATPVVAINNDDIDSVAAELREELGLPLFPVYCDGFRSKLSATGLDVAVHALLKHLLSERPRTPGTHVNLLSASASRADLQGLRSLLAEIGVPSLSFPVGSALDELERVASARLSVSLDGDEADPTGLALQAHHGVPLVAPAPPLGSAGTTRWLTALGEATGHAAQAALVAACHARHAHRLQRSTEALARFAGARVFVNLPGPLTFGFVELLAELGLHAAAIKLPSVGAPEQAALRALAERQPQLPVLVGEGQAFEEVNLLRRLAPDIYVGHDEPGVFALRAGIPVLDLAGGPLHGYAGAEAVAGQIAHRLGHPGLARFLGGGADGHHTTGWLARSTAWYIKQEVR